jgi:hypothetical protein
LGLLLAAIACEAKIKTLLVEIATTSQQPLVELVLDNPRDFSLAAAALFDKGLEAVTGVSMRRANRDLYKSVEDLFVHRNRFVHRRDMTLDESTIGADLTAARAAFAWLDDLRSQVASA